MESKARQRVRTIGADATVREAALAMDNGHVSCLVVAENDVPIGILNDRDIVMCTLRDEADPQEVLVSDCMSSPVVSMSADEGLTEASKKMRHHHVRKLPLVDSNGRLVGLVTADDLVMGFGQQIFDLTEAVRRELANEKAVSESGSSIFGKE